MTGNDYSFEKGINIKKKPLMSNYFIYIILKLVGKTFVRHRYEDAE
jgi:hypothetical protein